MPVSFRVFLTALLALFAGSVALQAQSPAPSPSPSPTPAAFSAEAHVDVTATAQTVFNLSAQLAVAQRGPLIRIDVVSVKSDSLPIPPIAATAVIDRRVNTLTVWNDATKQYFVQPIVPRAASPSPRPSTAPRPSPSPRRSPARAPFAGMSPLAKLEVLDVVLHLTGHTTTAGIPTTGVTFDLKVKKQGDPQTSHVTAATQLADDYAMFPVTADVSLEPGTAPFSAKLAYAVDRFTRTPPADTQFQLPAGYTKAGSLLTVIFPQRGRSASPGPRASP